MDPQELKILKQIEAAATYDDAAFAERIASGPRFSWRYRVALGVAILAGLALLALFPSHVAFGVAGYLVLVAAGTHALRRRPVKPIDESPRDFFHRLTAGLFRNTEPLTEPSLD